VAVTKNEFGQLNAWAKEPTMYVDPKAEQQMKDGIYETHNERAERLNGRVCMVGFTAGIISYVLTGTLGFGLF
jgi:hypothetical protein